MGTTVAEVEDILRRAFLAGHELRREDRQKALELAPLLQEVARFASTKKARVLVDACAGKSALGVIAASLHPALTVFALERVSERRARALEAARVLGVVERVAFVDTDVGDVSAWPKAPDVVVALHACGGASDAVIDVAMQVDARAILVVPCCYAGGPKHDVPPASASASASAQSPSQAVADLWRARVPLPEHGLVGRRFSQALIDAERTLRLEAHGYETEVVEVFSPSVSPYNHLWRARRVNEPVRTQRAREQWAKLVDKG